MLESQGLDSSVGSVLSYSRSSARFSLKRKFVQFLGVSHYLNLAQARYSRSSENWTGLCGLLAVKMSLKQLGHDDE